MILRLGAAARRLRVRCLTCAGDRTLRLPPVSWSRSNRITPPSPDSASAVWTHGASFTSLPRNPTTMSPAILWARSTVRAGVGVGVATGGGGGARGVGGGGVGGGLVARAALAAARRAGAHRPPAAPKQG